jgi:hypothetical protein
VSYKPVFSADARTAWRSLELALQEIILDEIDRLAEHTDRLAFRGTNDAAVCDFKTNIGTSVHYIFITAKLEEESNTLQILTIGHYARTSGATS